MRALVLALLVVVPGLARAGELVYTVEPASKLDATVAAVGKRLAGWGLGTAKKRGRELVVELDGVRDEEELRTIEWLVTTPGRVEVAPVVTGSKLMRTLEARVTADPAAKAAGIDVRNDDWVHDTTAFADRYLYARDREAVEAYLDRAGVKRGAIVVGRAGASWRTDVVDPSWRTHVLDARRRLVLSPAGVEIVDSFASEEPQVIMILDAASARRLGELSGARIGHKIAVLIDGEVSSVPVLAARLSARFGLVVPRASSPGEQLRRAQALALVVASPLPGRLRERSRKITSAEACPGCSEDQACKRGDLGACERACAAGPAARCLESIRLLVDGPARLQHHGLALALAERACAADEPSGCAIAARLHLHGVGVPLEVADAWARLDKACAASARDACAELAELRVLARTMCFDEAAMDAVAYCDALIQHDEPATAARARAKLDEEARAIEDYEKRMKAK